jgi:muramoyltetrapeptide carboxypeptidase
MQHGIATLESWGLKVQLSPQLYGVHHQFSGTDADRVADLQQLLDDSSIRAIFFARGGYGTARLLPQLFLSSQRTNPKWVVGYSDATALHLALYRIGVQTLHAAMPHRFGDAASVESLRAALFGASIGESSNPPTGESSNHQIIKFSNLSYTFAPHEMNIGGEAEGRLVGGNLSVLCSLQSTPYELQPKGAILFIEDLNEQLYHLDRMMLNLALGKQLRRLRGVIVGGLTDMKDSVPPYGKTAQAIIREHVEPHGIPLAFGFPAGHQSPNLALRLGAELKLEATAERCTITFRGG